MNDDVKAAAERLRMSGLDKSVGIPSVSYGGCRKAYGDDIEGANNKRRRDMAYLARAYLAEHPADDDESVTREWFPQQIASGDLRVRIFWRDDGAALGLILIGPNGVIRVRDNPTRGDVRLLLRVWESR